MSDFEIRQTDADVPDLPGPDDCVCRKYWETIKAGNAKTRFEIANQFLGYINGLSVFGVITADDYENLRYRVFAVMDAAWRELA